MPAAAIIKSFVDIKSSSTLVVSLHLRGDHLTVPRILEPFFTLIRVTHLRSALTNNVRIANAILIPIEDGSYKYRPSYLQHEHSKIYLPYRSNSEAVNHI